MIVLVHQLRIIYGMTWLERRNIHLVRLGLWWFLMDFVSKALLHIHELFKTVHLIGSFVRLVCLVCPSLFFTYYWYYLDLKYCIIENQEGSLTC